MKILIADGCPNTRRTLATQLTERGHDVTAAADGREAWELVQRDAYQVVLADWNLSHVQGPSLCRRIRDLSRPQYIYLFLLVPPDLECIEPGLDAGADDFLAKPCRTPELAARLGVAERLLRLHGRVTRLEGMLSICSYCKKIRDERAQWISVDRYIAGRTGVAFSHGICPTCIEDPLVVGL